MDKEQFIEEVIEGISKFRIIPFFGAGMSVPAGATDWGELIKILKIELNTSTTDYLMVAQEYEKTFGRQTLLNKIESHCTLKIKSSTVLKNQMRILAMNPPVIYTTNFDDAIETAAQLLKREYLKIVGLKDIVTSAHGARQIIKFHGDFSEPDSIVFTNNDYEHRLKIERNPLDVLFRAHILGKSVLFLGYSFSDKNIDYIFKLHADLYGTDVLHKSYIISFKSDQKKEEELRRKNVLTLVLESPSELESLLNQIGEKVSANSFENFFDEMNSSSVSPVITDFELSDIKKIFSDNEFTPVQLAEKLRRTIELKEIPDDVEDDLADFIDSILTGDYDIHIKKEIAFSFQHIQFKKTKSVLKIAFSLMPLSEYSEFRVGLKQNFEIDILILIEMKLGQCFGATESRKILSVVTLAYLEGKKSENKKLEFAHVDRLLTVLKDCRYEEFGDIELGDYTTGKIKNILDYYFSVHGRTLKARFDFPSIAGRHTATEIKDSSEISYILVGHFISSWGRS